MFKLESYVTPIILNYVAKYVKDIRPEDSQVSLWEGEVTFQNLDMRLDVLEEEINSPFEFISGHIYELSIHVPWTKITSEPIKITVNTIEFVLKLKDTQGNSASSSPQRRAGRSRRAVANGDEPPGTALPGLVNKIINNISLECHNIILKYVEEDIVLSMNVQYLSVGSADEHWNPAMADVNPVHVLMRKLINVTDLTICIDKRNAAGQIEVCQEPVLYRCTLQCRIMRKYNAKTAKISSITRVGVFTKSIDVNFSSLQFPLLIRLVNILTNFQSSQKESPPVDLNPDEEPEPEANANRQQSYFAWAWNMLPSFYDTGPENYDDDSNETPGHTIDLGFYLEQFNCTLKMSEYVMDYVLGCIKRIRYFPIVRVSLGAVYLEQVKAAECNWSNIKAGLSSISVEPLGAYSTDDKVGQSLVQTESFESAVHFIDKSLFDSQCLKADRGWSVTNYEEYCSRITDEYLMYRSPILAFDLIEYKLATNGNEMQIATQELSNECACNETRVQYRVLSSGITFRYNHTFLQVKNVITDLIHSYDYPAYHTETQEAAGVGTAANGNIPKLHPPLIEDYEALMQCVPRRSYKFNIKRFGIEVYAKTEADVSQRGQRRGVGGVGGAYQKDTPPNFLLFFDEIEGSHDKPLQPEKLVNTTCQLPDKPKELIEACYKNVIMNVKDCSLSLVNRVHSRSFKLLHIPKLQLTYGHLLQPHYWKEDELAIAKLDLRCDQFFIEFSKRELIASERLLYCVFQDRPHLLNKTTRDVSHQCERRSDSIKLVNKFQKLRIQFQKYHTYTIYNVSLRGLQSDVVPYDIFEGNRATVFTSFSKAHNNQTKWLECQVQVPSVGASDRPGAKVQDRKKVTVVALWVEKFKFYIDVNLLEFLEYQDEYEFVVEKESSVEVELQTQIINQYSNLNNSTPNAMPPPLVRRSSRNSLSGRRISQPEETVHFSSERDDRIEVDTSVALKSDDVRKNHSLTLDFMKSFIILVEIASSKLRISETFCRNLSGSSESEFTQIVLPKVTLKTPHADQIIRTNLRQKVSFPTNVKENLNWSITLKDLAIVICKDNSMDYVLQPMDTAVSIALAHKKEVKSKPLRVKEESAQVATTAPAPKPSNVGRSAETSGDRQGELSVSPAISNSSLNTEKDSSSEQLQHMFEENKKDDINTREEHVMSVGSSGQKPLKGQRLKDVVTLSIYADTKPIAVMVSTKKAKILQRHFDVLIKVSELMRVVARANASSTMQVAQPLQIVTPSEEIATLKEFLDLETNTESSLPSEKKTADESSFALSLFCQWTIARVIAEVQREEGGPKQNKLVMELEDLLSTVDKRDDYTKCTSKIGNLSVNYFEANSKGEWSAHEYLRVKMLGESVNLPFFNVIYTRVSLKDFYGKIGGNKLKGEGDQSKHISEVVVKMQALEAIVDLDRVADFILPFCVMLEKRESRRGDDHHAGKGGKAPIAASDLPLIHLESKGFHLYLPLETGLECCTVVVCKIDHINITPNLENSLQRTPIRADVFGKAAQMGILGTPGSLIEDRQYELTLGNVSAASGNWSEILAHMREQADNFHRTNPAFEWNNQNRKPSLHLTEIFSNFKFIAIFAPCIVYNNVLICGQAIEFNCASDLVASINTNQLNLLGCIAMRLQSISCIINRACNYVRAEKSPVLYKAMAAAKEAKIVSSPAIRVSSSLSFLSINDCQAVASRSSIIDFRHLNSRSQGYEVRPVPSVFESIDESIEHHPPTDSGFLSSAPPPSRSSHSQKTTSSGLKSASLNHDVPAQTEHLPPERQVPHTLSMVAGIFLLRIFDINRPKNDSTGETVNVPLISVTISQPSFMRTQNIFDVTTQASLYNLVVHSSTDEVMEAWEIGELEKGSRLFPEVIFDTRPGESSPSGIPPPLVNFKEHRSQTQFVDVEVDVLKSIVLYLNEEHVQRFVKNLLLIYDVLLDNNCIELCRERPVERGSKISLLRRRCFNADRLRVRCNQLQIRFLHEDLFDCKFICSGVRLNGKFLKRPEKASFKASVGSMLVQTENKIFIHPISLRASLDLVKEAWHRLPLVMASVKFNVINVDLGIYGLLQLRKAKRGLDNTLEFLSGEWESFQRSHRRPEQEAINRDDWQPIKCLNAAQREMKARQRSLQHQEEFYQDDLRAGAFQFVEVSSDSFLPLPYQIQIVKKNNGIICWRYPQPREMFKIHIYPVPMATERPLHIKCRMEYFSEVHECFLNYCEFYLSETVSKEINLPQRHISAYIWRVVIMQSLVSVNGDCFDTSEEDEELLSIPSMDIKNIFSGEGAHTDFLLHPKILVGCMRIDSAFQSAHVPKAQVLVSCKSVQVKLLNQNESGELPNLLKKFRLVGSTKISQAFLELQLRNVQLHGTFHDRDQYTVDTDVLASVKCIDYGFLNMLHLLEPTTMRSSVQVNSPGCTVAANVTFDRLRLNMGPSIIHALLSSKTHWEEMLDKNPDRLCHALIPKCIVVNRTLSPLAFAQTGTKERVHLQPQECHLYSFRSDLHPQELTFFVTDHEVSMLESSQSVPVQLKFEGEVLLQPVRIGSKALIIKSKKLSATQIYIMIKGQIELVSMVPQEFVLEFRRDGKINEDHIMLEHSIDARGRASFCSSVLKQSNMTMRLKLPNYKGKGRSGDIPLRTNKSLPWLVKVPTVNNEFISFWVRVLREDIPEISSEQFEPQKILIMIWPIFVVRSMLTCEVAAEEKSTPENFVVKGEVGRKVLSVPATHLTEHEVEFNYGFPVSKETPIKHTLSLKSLDWSKFFWYDENLWTVEHALDSLSKSTIAKFPLDDEEELRVQRNLCNAGQPCIEFRERVYREFSCSLCLDLLPWALFVNATGIEVSVCDADTKQRLEVAPNCVDMLFRIEKAFTIDVRHGGIWLASKVIYYDDDKTEESVAGAKGVGGRRSSLSLANSSRVDILILRGEEVVKLILDLKYENGRRIFRLRPKFVAVNFTKSEFSLLLFAMDQKEISSRGEVAALDKRATKRNVKPVEFLDNSIGSTLDCFYDLNAKKLKRSNDTSFAYFVCVHFCDETSFSMPVLLTTPFIRRCFSVQRGSESIALVVSVIEKDGTHYLNIVEDVAPGFLINNQTDVTFTVAQTNAAENASVTATSNEYVGGKHFHWQQILPAYSRVFYTPLEMYVNFPDVESTVCNLTLAVHSSAVAEQQQQQQKKKQTKWSKPLRTDKTWEKFLHVPNHGDVKVTICNKHRVTRLSIFYLAKQKEFSVKDLRSRLLKPGETSEASLMSDNAIASVAADEPSPDDVHVISDSSLTCSHFSDKYKGKSSFKLRFFIKETILNLHTDDKTRDYMKSEVFSLLIDDFTLAYDDNDLEREMNVVMPNLQIDNQLFSTGKYDFPVVLCSEEAYKRSEQIPDVYDLDGSYVDLFKRTSMVWLQLKFFEDEMKLSSIDCTLSPIRAYIEDAYVNDLLEVLVELAPSNSVYKSKPEESRRLLGDGLMLVPRDIVAQALCMSEPLQLRSFRIAPLNVLLSVHTSLRLYIALDHSPLSFSIYERRQILTTSLRFGQSLGMHYLSGAIFGAGWVVGSLEILGSPSALARSVTMGLRDFVSMPVEGLLRGPWGFLVGITQGSASLLCNVTAGTVNSVSKLAASVARNLDRLSLDHDHIERTEALRRSRPQGFTEGFSQGLTGLGISILGAVGGLARHTLEARSTAGVVAGVGKGLLGAFTKPISGAAELVALAGQGMLQTVGFNTLPQQRAPSVSHNLAVHPSEYRIWKLLPDVLASDQLMFSSEITLVVKNQLKQAYVFLTSTVFAIMEAQWDKLEFVCPVDKVELTCDRNDKTLIYVHLLQEREEIEENLNYTNQRIMTFLATSFTVKGMPVMTTDSLNDLLHSAQDPSYQNLDWSFYINEPFGEYIIQYIKIIKNKN